MLPGFTDPEIKLEDYIRPECTTVKLYVGKNKQNWLLYVYNSSYRDSISRGSAALKT